MDKNAVYKKFFVTMVIILLIILLYTIFFTFVPKIIKDVIMYAIAGLQIGNWLGDFILYLAKRGSK